MNSEIKDKWVNALRSGEYEQGQGRLHSVWHANGDNKKHTYCCLGVLCELLAAEGTITKGKECPTSKEFSQIGYLSNESAKSLSNFDLCANYGNIDTAIQRIVGLDESTIEELISMNDEKDCSFKEIANYIETLP